MSRSLADRRPLAPRPARARGQVIILAALTVLLLAFALTISLSISWSVRERIRVQNAADANAYSSAVLAARAYNYFAYTNRSIAGAFVAEAMLSAYHSEISAAADLYYGMGYAYFEMAGEEFAEGCCGWCVYSCCPCIIPGCAQHCVHALEDIVQAGLFIASATEVSNDIQSLDPPFRRAMSSWQTMVQLMETSQTLLKADVAARLGLGGVKLEEENVPQGSAGYVALGAINALHFNAPINSTNSVDKQRDMTEVINASRPSWTRARGDASNFPAMAYTPLVLEPLGEKVNRKANGGWLIVEQTPFGTGGAAGAAQNKNLGWFWTPPPSPNSRANSIGSRDWWAFTTFCKHYCAVGEGVMPLIGGIMPAKVFTAESASEHVGVLNNPHDGTMHDQFQVERLQSYYSYSTEKTRSPWQQPAIYGYAERQLAKGPNGQLQPFYVTASGITSPQLVGEKVALHLASSQTSRALSKALVYYHRIGDWKEPPNFFNPYWRVKLHPFGSLEWAEAAGAALSASAAFTGELGVGTASGEAAMAP